MHYFFLSVFTWSLCEGVLIYNLLVKVFGVNKKKWIYIYTALGWGNKHLYVIMDIYKIACMYICITISSISGSVLQGLPIPAVIVSVAIRHEVYFRRASFDTSDPFYEYIHA